ncbi:fatty acid synthase alpha subunit Lsd1, partial [Coemansia erecta]
MQFTQVALVIFSIASVADMQSKQLIQKEAVFAGHSLGEYCDLATLTDIFTLEDVIDIVFYRGLVMQSAVGHDYLGNSQYGMVAVNPSRVGSWFSETELAVVVAAIARQGNNPNLTAKPFEITKSYFEQVFKLTGSSVICDILNNWFDNTDKTAELAAALVVELLAYQFASPVQWISTQDQLFNRFGIAHYVEIGASPVLCGMADKTLQRLHSSNNSIAVLYVDRDKDKVYYTERLDKKDDSSSNSSSVFGNDDAP